MEQQADNAPEATTAPPSGLERVLRPLAWPISALAGLYYGHAYIRNHSYDKLKNMGLFRNKWNERNETIQKLVPEWGVQKDVSDEIKAANLVYSTHTEERMAELGFQSVSKRFSLLHHTQKFEALLNAFTAFGVSLGVIFSITEHKDLADKLSAKDSSQQQSK